jgi:multidrug resistance efflux pump
MRSGKVLIYIAWIIAVGLLTIITLYNQEKVDSFMGLTQSKQRTLNFPFPVQVQKMYVAIGEEVKQGQKLADALRIDTKDKSFTINAKINELETKRILKTDEIKGNLQSLEVRMHKDISKIEMQIKALKQKEKMNAALMQSVYTDNSRISSVHYKIEALLEEKKNLEELYRTKKVNLQTMLVNTNKRIDAQIKQLKSKEKVLEKESKTITIYAPYDGNIGSIGCTSGEALKAYTPILTIHPVYPQYVTGYIHEDVQTDIKIGEKVIIEPLSDLYKNIAPIEGVVQSISTRIVSFPVRLKKFKVVPLWGYKVLIKIPKNSLKLGQKVSVTKEVDHNRTGAKFFNMLDSIELH